MTYLLVWEFSFGGRPASVQMLAASQSKRPPNYDCLAQTTTKSEEKMNKNGPQKFQEDDHQIRSMTTNSGTWPPIPEHDHQFRTRNSFDHQISIDSFFYTHFLEVVGRDLLSHLFWRRLRHQS